MVILSIEAGQVSSLWKGKKSKVFVINGKGLLGNERLCLVCGLKTVMFWVVVGFFTMLLLSNLWKEVTGLVIPHIGSRYEYWYPKNCKELTSSSWRKSQSICWFLTTKVTFAMFNRMLQLKACCIFSGAYLHLSASMDFVRCMYIQLRTCSGFWRVWVPHKFLMLMATLWMNLTRTGDYIYIF